MTVSETSSLTTQAHPNTWALPWQTYSYEYDVLHTLGQHGFELEHVGQKGDRGVDLWGVWRLPDHGADPVRVIVQCKNSTRRVGVSFLRDLVGVLCMEQRCTRRGWSRARSVLDPSCLQRLSARTCKISASF